MAIKSDDKNFRINNNNAVDVHVESGLPEAYLLGRLQEQLAER